MSASAGYKIPSLKMGGNLVDGPRGASPSISFPSAYTCKCL